MATGTQADDEPMDEPMDDEHRNILRRCREAFVKDMDPIEVLRKMVDPHLFSTEEENKIKGKGLTREEQCEMLLDILPRKEIRELKSELETERKKSARLQRRLTPELKAVKAKRKEVGYPLKRKEKELRDVEGKYKDVESRLKEKQEELKTVEAKGKDVGNRLERKQEELKTVEAKGMDLKIRLERQQEGISGSRPLEKPSKRIIFAELQDWNTIDNSCTKISRYLCHRLIDTGTRPLPMGLPEPSTPIQAEQVSFAEMDTGTRPLAMGSVEPSGPIPAENLDSQKVHSVERSQACLQCNKLAEELSDLKTEVNRIRQQHDLKWKTLDEEVKKYKNAVSPSSQEGKKPKRKGSKKKAMAN